MGQRKKTIEPERKEMGFSSRRRALGRFPLKAE